MDKSKVPYFFMADSVYKAQNMLHITLDM